MEALWKRSVCYQLYDGITVSVPGAILRPETINVSDVRDYLFVALYIGTTSEENQPVKAGDLMEVVLSGSILDRVNGFPPYAVNSTASRRKCVSLSQRTALILSDAEESAASTGTVIFSCGSGMEALGLLQFAR